MNLIARKSRWPKTIACLVYDQGMSLDAAGPLETFATAGEISLERDGLEPYRLAVVSPDGRPVRFSSGLRLEADFSLVELAESDRAAGIDTLIIAGGTGAQRMRTDEVFLAQVRRLAARVRRLASVCTGTFILAAAGLLEGRRATTHWWRSAQLQTDYPAVRVEPDAIYIKDGPIYTSAGVTAGIDLALVLVEEDLGPDIASAAARMLVLHYRRPGGQSQYSDSLAAQADASGCFRELSDWLVSHLTERITVDDMAAFCLMSPRHFARVFARQTGVTPGRFLELLRLDRARLLLETTDLDLGEVAALSGLAGADRLRKTCQRRMGLSPTDYRTAFRQRAENIN